MCRGKTTEVLGNDLDQSFRAGGILITDTPAVPTNDVTRTNVSFSAPC